MLKEVIVLDDVARIYLFPEAEKASLVIRSEVTTIPGFTDFRIKRFMCKFLLIVIM
jgi:hypothetical protein